MTIHTHEADQETRRRVHAALAEFGYVLIECLVEDAGVCGYPGGCTTAADRALFTEFEDGESGTPLPCCGTHLVDAASAAVTVYSGDPEDGSPQSIPLFRAG